MSDSSSTAASATGTERVAAAFAAAKDEGRAALMPYMMGGFPDQAASMSVAEAYVEGGADLIELGVPFSDPLADGPVIHAADTAALNAGATLESVLEICGEVGARVPVALMCYANMILAKGPDQFADAASEAGAAAVIVPDLPLEEQGEIGKPLSDRGLALVPMVAPTTPVERRTAICAEAQGFVYVVSTVGVTGERDELPPELTELVEAVKDEAGVPAAVGFGISTPEQAATVGEIAGGVIIGTRLVREVAESDIDAAVAAVTEFLRETRSALGR